jgi:hypothetical protein
LAAAAERDFGEQYLTLDGGALPWAQLAERYDAGAIFVAQGQKEQQILGGFDSQCPQTRGKRLAHAA